MAPKELKESHPIQVADHAISNNLQEEPAFAWWLPHVNEKRNAIVSEVESKHFQRTHKRGFGIPKTWEEALETDKGSGDHLWEEAIEQEMKNGQVAFQACNGDIKDSIGCEQITCHLMFDTKLSDASGGRPGLQQTAKRSQLPHP